MTCDERITTYESGARVRVEAAKDHDAVALNAAMLAFNTDTCSYEEHDDGSRTFDLVVARGAVRALIEALEAIEGVVEVETVRS